MQTKAIRNARVGAAIIKGISKMSGGIGKKELSKKEYDQLKSNLSGVYLIENSHEGSYINECKVSELFNKFNQQHVLTY